MTPERERSVAVIGGLGRMGTVTRRIFEQSGYTPVISDIKDLTTTSVREAIRRSQIIFFSVLPIESIGNIIKANADIFDKDHRVMDNASLKNPLKEGYQLLDGKQVSICSTHPLCKHDQPLHGQGVFIAPFGQNPQEAILVAERVYKNAGMVLIRVDFDKHDSLSIPSQPLPHLINRAVGIVLADLGIDQTALDKIATANSRLFSLAVWRTLVQDPAISAVIVRDFLQKSEGIQIIKDIKDALDRILEASKTPDKLEQVFRETVEKLDPLGNIKPTMNERTITVLERLANLQLRSVAIEANEDRPGLLRAMLGPLEEAGINLNAIDSHQTDKVIRFHIGIESGKITPETLKRLESLGFKVIDITAS